MQALETGLKCERNTPGSTCSAGLACPSQAVKTEDLAKDSGQYAATLQHVDHLDATATSADVQERPRKVNYLIFSFYYFML